jgi:fructose-specific phosphotransferase system IIC component
MDAQSDVSYWHLADTLGGRPRTGIAGAFVGGWLAQLMNFQFEGWLGNLLVAAVGALLVLWLWRFATGYRSA